MKVQIARWGNSTAVRFPKSVVDTMRLEPGTQLELVVDGAEIRLSRPHSRSRQLLEMMAEEANRLGADREPATIDWGPDRGSERIEDDDPR